MHPEERSIPLWILVFSPLRSSWNGGGFAGRLGRFLVRADRALLAVCSRGLRVSGAVPGALPLLEGTSPVGSGPHPYDLCDLNYLPMSPALNTVTLGWVRASLWEFGGNTT